MRWITLNAARTATGALLAVGIVTMSTHATEPLQWRPVTMPTSTSFIVLRDYQLKDVQPCLIGLRNCPSTYPPPTPCLASTARCSADAHGQWANTQERNESRVP
jgi:hypothetical protein